LIRGISQIATERLGVLVVMCTNRADALDPAVRRRAAAEFDFARPNDAQREAVLTAIFDGVGLKQSEILDLVRLTGPNGRGYGYTYSDLVDRIFAGVCLAASAGPSERFSVHRRDREAAGAPFFRAPAACRCARTTDESTLITHSTG